MSIFLKKLAVSFLVTIFAIQSTGLNYYSNNLQSNSSALRAMMGAVSDNEFLKNTDGGLQKFLLTDEGSEFINQRLEKSVKASSAGDLKEGEHYLMINNEKVYLSSEIVFKIAREGCDNPKDYWLNPMVACNVDGKPIRLIDKNSVIIEGDHRSDRATPGDRVLRDPAFNKFLRKDISGSVILSLADYDLELSKELGLESMFSSDDLFTDVEVTASDVWEMEGKVVAYITETEKFKHITYYFWNRKAKKLKYGYTKMIPSYEGNHANKPEMQSVRISDVAIECMCGINGCQKADVVVINYPNGDILKHLGVYEASVKGQEAVDKGVKRVLTAAGALGGFGIVTADHRAADETMELDDKGHFIRWPKGHLNAGEPVPSVLHHKPEGTVPYVVYGYGTIDECPFILRSGGSVVNAIPTVLDLQGLPIPAGKAESLIVTKQGREDFERKTGPAVIIIRDGVGNQFYNTEDARKCNALLEADTPFNDMLMKDYPHTNLVAHGQKVGLPESQMGDSEACHENIGAMEIVEQALLKIKKSIENKTFAANPKLIMVLKEAKKRGEPVQIIHMTSDGGVHSHLDVLFAFIQCCKDYGVEVLIRCVHDYRDVSLLHTADYYENIILQKIKEMGMEGMATIVSHCGRGLWKDRDALNKMVSANRELLDCLKQCVLNPVLYFELMRQVPESVIDVLEQLKKNTINDHKFKRHLEILSLDDLLKIIAVIRKIINTGKFTDEKETIEVNSSKQLKRLKNRASVILKTTDNSVDITLEQRYEIHSVDDLNTIIDKGEDFLKSGKGSVIVEINRPILKIERASLEGLAEIKEKYISSDLLWKKRIEPAYRAMTYGEGIKYFATPEIAKEALKAAKASSTGTIRTLGDVKGEHKSSSVGNKNEDLKTFSEFETVEKLPKDCHSEAAGRRISTRRKILRGVYPERSRRTQDGENEVFQWSQIYNNTRKAINICA